MQLCYHQFHDFDHQTLYHVFDWSLTEQNLIQNSKRPEGQNEQDPWDVKTDIARQHQGVIEDCGTAKGYRRAAIAHTLGQEAVKR